MIMVKCCTVSQGVVDQKKKKMVKLVCMFVFFSICCGVLQVGVCISVLVHLNEYGFVMKKC